MSIPAVTAKHPLPVEKKIVPTPLSTTSGYQTRSTVDDRIALLSRQHQNIKELDAKEILKLHKAQGTVSAIFWNKESGRPIAHTLAETAFEMLRGINFDDDPVRVIRIKDCRNCHNAHDVAYDSRRVVAAQAAVKAYEIFAEFMKTGKLDKLNKWLTPDQIAGRRKAFKEHFYSYSSAGAARHGIRLNGPDDIIAYVVARLYFETVIEKSNELFSRPMMYVRYIDGDSRCPYAAQERARFELNQEQGYYHPMLNSDIPTETWQDALHYRAETTECPFHDKTNISPQKPLESTLAKS